MRSEVFIRPLEIEDAQTSYQWRNDPKIWRFTGSSPDRYITPEMETAWITQALRRENEVRYAICLREDNTYIGNVFFTDIKEGWAQLHIFIGEIRFWGRRRAYDAAWQALEQGFTKLGFILVYLEMHKNNPGLGNVIRMGCKPIAEFENGFVKYIFTREMFEQTQLAVASKQELETGN